MLESLLMKLQGFLKKETPTPNIFLQNIYGRLLLKGRFLLCLKLGKWVIFWPKINFFKLLSEFVHYIYLELYLMAGLDELVKVTLNFKGISYCSKWDKRVIFGPKINFLKFFTKSVRFFYNGIWRPALKCGKSDCLDF